jgi:hypothetical protein
VELLLMVWVRGDVPPHAKQLYDFAYKRTPDGEREKNLQFHPTSFPCFHFFRVLVLLFFLHQ